MTMARLRGALLGLASLAAAPALAVELTATLGAVQQQAAGAADWQPAAAGPLAAGTRLRVAAGAGAQLGSPLAAIWLRDGAEVEVVGDAELRLVAGGVQVRLLPAAGKPPKAPRLRISAPCGQVGVADGAAVVQVTDDEGCAVSNLLGPAVEVKGARGGRASVKRGAGVVVRKGRPGSTISLPAPPTWSGGKALTAVGRRAEDALVRGRLAVDAATRRVRVRLRSLAAELPAGELERAPGDPLFRTRGLAAGTWAIEAVARDADGLESAWSDPLVAEVQAADGPLPVTQGVDPGLPGGCGWAGTGNARCPDGDVPLALATAQAAWVGPAPARGKPAAVKLALSGAAVPPVLELRVAGKAWPLRATPAGLEATLTVPPGATEAEIRDPDQVDGPPVARLAIP